MRLNKGRILCVGNNDDNTLLLQRILEDNGYEVIATHTYAEALVQAHQTNFDLFLVDGCLSDGSSVQVCRHLLTKYPELPLALYCEKGDEDAIAAGGLAADIDAGGVTYLSMPLDVRILVREVEEILERVQH